MKSKKKSIFIAIGVVVLLVAVLGGIKASQIGAMIAAGESFEPPPQAVTTAEVREVQWSAELTAVGTLVAVQGVTVSTEVPGTVKAIRFDSGDMVDEGDLLVRLDTSIERAELAAAMATAQLANAELRRRRNLPPAGAVSQADLDAAAARATEAAAAVANVRAVIAKKTIRAPFGGRLGIRKIDLGEVLQPGTPIVSLQSADPIYAEFSLPQQALSRIDEGHAVSISTDAFPNDTWRGVVDVVDVEVDRDTRNFTVRAVVENPDGRLRPGMFVDVRVLGPQLRDLLVIPASAVLFAPYGDSVYVTKEEVDEGGDTRTTVEQVFVRLGERRGDLVVVTSGLNTGNEVVSTGAFKLQNGTSILVRNDLAPDAKSDPNPPNE